MLIHNLHCRDSFRIIGPLQRKQDLVAKHSVLIFFLDEILNLVMYSIVNDMSHYCEEVVYKQRLSFYT